MTSQITCSPKASPTFDRVGSRIEGRGVPVVLLHSSMSSKGQWRELIHRMRDRHRLIAIDPHGYGETSLTQSADCFALNGAATPSGHWQALRSESQWPQTAALCP